ncbi:uncharacterized protein PG998_002658 [Apiospora kogelbergensis]|uniref:uncharacterized protein n=1 Tax=Apiospora kogelbergensis TaxID=1337665 RepID=UPI00312F72FD
MGPTTGARGPTTKGKPGCSSSEPLGSRSSSALSRLKSGVAQAAGTPGPAAVVGHFEVFNVDPVLLGPVVQVDDPSFPVKHALLVGVDLTFNATRQGVKKEVDRIHARHHLVRFREPGRAHAQPFVLGQAVQGGLHLAVVDGGVRRRPAFELGAVAGREGGLRRVQALALETGHEEGVRVPLQPLQELPRGLGVLPHVVDHPGAADETHPLAGRGQNGAVDGAGVVEDELDELGGQLFEIEAGGGFPEDAMMKKIRRDKSVRSGSHKELEDDNATKILTSNH